MALEAPPKELDSDRLEGVLQVQRQEAPKIHGEVRVDFSKCCGVSKESRIGDLTIGMMGVTVHHSRGATMFPWRVIAWVEMDEVK